MIFKLVNEAFDGMTQAYHVALGWGYYNDKLGKIKSLGQAESKLSRQFRVSLDNVELNLK